MGRPSCTATGAAGCGTSAVCLSYQAYLDAIERKTGKTPEELSAVAAARGFTPQSKAGDFALWLKDDYDVGRVTRRHSSACSRTGR